MKKRLELQANGKGLGVEMGEMGRGVRDGKKRWQLGQPGVLACILEGKRSKVKLEGENNRGKGEGDLEGMLPEQNGTKSFVI